MEALQAIMTRRSVRHFHPQHAVSGEDIDKILHAAMSAPSAANQQPWHFIVVDDRDLLNKIPGLHQYAQMCKEAPLAIIIAIDMQQENYRDFWVEDLSAATQNVLLAARALGLGSVWVGLHPNGERVKSIQNLLNLQETIIPFSIIPIGYTDIAQKEVPDRFKKERIHYNKW